MSWTPTDEQVVQTATAIAEGGIGWQAGIMQAARAVLVAVGPHIAAQALRDAAEAWAEDPDSVDSETPADTRNWMRDRADQIEKEAGR